MQRFHLSALTGASATKEHISVVGNGNRRPHALQLKHLNYPWKKSRVCVVICFHLYTLYERFFNSKFQHITLELKLYRPLLFVV